MLCLTRKKAETIVIGDVVVKVLKVRGDKVLIGVEAPREVNVRRGELKERKVA